MCEAESQSPRCVAEAAKWGAKELAVDGARNWSSAADHHGGVTVWCLEFLHQPRFPVLEVVVLQLPRRVAKQARQSGPYALPAGAADRSPERDEDGAPALPLGHRGRIDRGAIHEPHHEGPGDASTSLPSTMCDGDMIEDDIPGIRLASFGLGIGPFTTAAETPDSRFAFPGSSCDAWTLAAEMRTRGKLDFANAKARRPRVMSRAPPHIRDHRRP